MSGELLVTLVLAGLAFIILAKTAVVVPQQSAYVVERLGRYAATLNAGLHILIPFLDVIRYKHTLKEMAEKPILNCLLFKGEAGIGKTNHLCHLCEKFGNEYPILFLSGGRMFLTGADSIEDEFRRSLDLIDDYYGAKLTEIEEISNLSGRYLILIIDAINECTNINKIKINLSQIISYWKERNIAFVISCRDIDWRFFDDETSLIDSIFFKEEVNYLSRSGTFMKEFSDEEFDMAWEKYKKYYKIKLRAATPP